MSNKPDLQTFLAARQWRVGYDEPSQSVGFEFIDGKGEGHRFCVPAGDAALIADRLHELLNAAGWRPKSAD